MFKTILGFALLFTSIILFAGIAGGIDKIAHEITFVQWVWLCSVFLTAFVSGLLSVMLIGDLNSDKL